MLSSFFGGRDRLTKLADNPNQSGFLRELATTDIFVLSVPFDTNVDPEALTEDQLRKIIEDSTKVLARNDQGFKPFTYKTGDVRTLPFFTTQKLATKFMQSYVNRVRRIIPFGSLRLQGDAIPSIMDVADRWLLNAETKHEVDVKINKLSPVLIGKFVKS